MPPVAGRFKPRLFPIRAAFKMPIGILRVGAIRRSVSSLAATKRRSGAFGRRVSRQVVRCGFAQALEGDRIRHGQAALNDMKDNLRNPAFGERDDERFDSSRLRHARSNQRLAPSASE
jgi:hypothetical protein